MEKLRQRLTDYLNFLDDDELISIHNRYCECDIRPDDIVYPMSMLNALINTEGKFATDVLNECKYVNKYHKYLVYTIYGLESFDNFDDKFSIYDIIEYIIRTRNSLNCNDIDDILNDDMKGE